MIEEFTLSGELYATREELENGFARASIAVRVDGDYHFEWREPDSVDVFIELVDDLDGGRERGYLMRGTIVGPRAHVVAKVERLAESFNSCGIRFQLELDDAKLENDAIVVLRHAP